MVCCVLTHLLHKCDFKGHLHSNIFYRLLNYFMVMSFSVSDCFKSDLSTTTHSSFFKTVFFLIDFLAIAYSLGLSETIKILLLQVSSHNAGSKHVQYIIKYNIRNHQILQKKI